MKTAGLKDNLKDPLKVALAFLSYRGRSVKEVEAKLCKKGFSAAQTAATIDYLIFSGYLDDRGFAKALAESRVRNKHWGARRVAADLGAKGIAEDIVREAVSGISAEDEARAVATAFEKWLRKTGFKIPLEKKAFEKAFRHLVARGFSAHVITGLLKGGAEGD